MTTSDRGQAGRHRLGDHQWHPLHVPVRGRHARGDEEVRFRHQSGDLAASAPSQELDPASQSVRPRQFLERAAQRSVADDSRPKDAAFTGDPHRPDEVFESLLLHQPPHCKQRRRRLPAASIHEWKILEPDSEAMHPDPFRRRSRVPEPRREVVGIRKKKRCSLEEFAIHLLTMLPSLPRDVVAVERDRHRAGDDARVDHLQHDPAHRTEFTVDRVVPTAPTDRGGDLEELAARPAPAAGGAHRPEGDAGVAHEA